MIFFGQCKQSLKGTGTARIAEENRGLVCHPQNGPAKWSENSIEDTPSTTHPIETGGFA